jgi:ABC transport system ATP-binding/permease protein
LRTTEQAIAKVTTRRDRLAEQLAGLQDHGELVRIGAELTAVQAELDQLEETWLELAEMSSPAL